MDYADTEEDFSLLSKRFNKSTKKKNQPPFAATIKAKTRNPNKSVTQEFLVLSPEQRKKKKELNDQLLKLKPVPS